MNSKHGWFKIAPTQVQELGTPPICFHLDRDGYICVNLDDVVAQLPDIDPYFTMLLLIASPQTSTTEPTWA